MKTLKSCRHCLIMLFVAVLAATLLGGCQPTTTGIPSTKLAPTVNTSAVEADRTGTTGSASPDGESPDAVLSSLKKVDDYPFYTMHYAGAYHEANTRWKIDPPGLQSRKEYPEPGWACTLFSAFNDRGTKVFGRNFDWRFSPAMLLFTEPVDGYASATMVDISYLVDPAEIHDLEKLTAVQRQALLQTPYWPFDGMNEHGLVVGMAAVSSHKMPYDAGKESVDSLMIMRLILDHARNVGEALQILGSYNIDWAEGPALHYLVADPTGRAALVEFVDGEMVVLPHEGDWIAATNFLRTIDPHNSEAGCWR